MVGDDGGGVVGRVAGGLGGMALPPPARTRWVCPPRGHAGPRRLRRSPSQLELARRCCARDDGRGEV